MNILSYDYHSAFEPAVNHHSPLHPLEDDNEYNFDAQLSIVSKQLLVYNTIMQHNDKTCFYIKFNLRSGIWFSIFLHICK